MYFGNSKGTQGPGQDATAKQIVQTSWHGAQPQVRQLDPGPCVWHHLLLLAFLGRKKAFSQDGAVPPCFCKHVSWTLGHSIVSPPF